MKWLPSVLSALLAVIAIFHGPIVDFVSAHAQLCAVLGGIGGVIAHVLPSPFSPAAQ